jgi:FAD/FMN-containing dehydrogenase
MPPRTPPHTIDGFTGQLVAPDDFTYDDVRQVFNGMIDRRPALIARCSGPADIAAAIRYGREHDLPIAVRSGGHHVGGFSVVDDGLVIDTSLMKRVEVDPVARTCKTDTGVLWGEFDRSTTQHGLAVTGGRVTTTGVTGFTLGSGSGFLERQFGLACDNVVAAEMVTVEGELVQVDEENHPELLWALRGAGTNFGILTSLTLKLYPIGEQVLAGLMMFEAKDRAAFVAGWRDVMESSPSETQTGLVLMTIPDAPFVPEQYRGRLGIGITFVHAGDLAAGERVVEELRAIEQPIVDLVQPVPYTESQRLIDPLCCPHFRHYWKSDHIRSFDERAIEDIVASAAEPSSPLTQLTIEAKGRAIADVDENHSPLGGRDAPYGYYCLTIWEDAEEDERHIEWARSVQDAMRPHAAPGMALNFVQDEGPRRVRDAFSDRTYERLVALKREWDPENVLRLNQNIPPDGSADTGAA